jgi:hypothetical protein
LGGADKKRFAPTVTLTDDALADSTPLFQTISHYMDDNMLARIAAEYAKGRLLFIQTANLDAGQSVCWNIGAVAASGHPGALDLTRAIFDRSISLAQKIACIALSFQSRPRTPESHLK